MSRVFTFLSGIVSLECSPLPNLVEEHPASLQLQITTKCLQRVILHFSYGQQQPSRHTYMTRPLTACLSIDAALFEEEEELSRVLVPQLERIGIIRDWTTEVASKVREDVKRILNEGRKARGLNVSIVYKEMNMVFDSVSDRVIWESRLEHENGNYGMVAADSDAVEKMMKSVRIGDKEKEECRICLEEMKETGKSFPSGHLFHADCVLRWLQTSHYCPLCRF